MSKTVIAMKYQESLLIQNLTIANAMEKIHIIATVLNTRETVTRVL